MRRQDVIRGVIAQIRELKSLRPHIYFHNGIKGSTELLPSVLDINRARPQTRPRPLITVSSTPSCGSLISTFANICQSAFQLPYDLITPGTGFWCHIIGILNIGAGLPAAFDSSTD